MSRIKNPVKYFRLLERSSSLNSKIDNPETLTESIVRNNHYIYIDINEDCGMCEMQVIKPEQATKDTQLFAKNNYVCSLQNCNLLSQQGMQYIYKNKQIRQKKQKFKTLLKEYFASEAQNKKKKINKSRLNQSKQTKIEIENSFNKSEVQSGQKIKKKLVDSILGASRLERSSKNQSAILYKQSESKDLESYVDMKQLQKTNKKILKREIQLIAKYGFTNKYQSLTKQQSPIVRKRAKVLLPQIKSSINILN